MKAYLQMTPHILGTDKLSTFYALYLCGHKVDNLYHNILNKLDNGCTAYPYRSLNPSHAICGLVLTTHRLACLYCQCDASLYVKLAQLVVALE